jgi:hypothetical protein
MNPFGCGRYMTPSTIDSAKSIKVLITAQNVRKELSEFVPKGDEQLESMMALSEIFGENGPPGGHLHIIAKPPYVGACA